MYLYIIQSKCIYLYTNILLAVISIHIYLYTKAIMQLLAAPTGGNLCAQRQAAVAFREGVCCLIFGIVFLP